MSTTVPPLGTHFSDGVRVGPTLSSKFTASVNPLYPSVPVATALDSLPPGIYDTPMSYIDMVPAAVTADAVVASVVPAGAGYLSLQAISTANIKWMSSFSNTTGIANGGVIALDVPRNLTITGVAGTVSQTFTIWGWDQYEQPMVEIITGPTDATVSYGLKAWKYIQAVYCSGATTDAITVGVGNAFGLPYFCNSEEYLGIPEWDLVPDQGIPNYSSGLVGPLGADPITTGTMGTGVITVTVTSTADLFDGQFVTISGATATDGITAVQLNTTAPITILSATEFAYNSVGSATVGGVSGGGVAVDYIPTNFGIAGRFTVGDPETATGTTGDVRGTYQPSFDADGTTKLTINFYSASGDSRKYNAALTSSLILGSDPLATTNTTTTITVTAPDHRFTNGENVTISGGTVTINNIAAANYNITAPVTILDNQTFTYQALSVANATGSGLGGTGITLSPGKGNLYQTTTGRFGVSQYVQSLT